MRPSLLVLLALICAAPAAAQRWSVRDRTNGIRFEPPIWCIAGAPSDAQVAYAGTRYGKIVFTRDGGETWAETSALTNASGSFIGARRTQVNLTGIAIRRAETEVLNEARARGVRSSVGQVLAEVPRTSALPRQADTGESIRQMVDSALAPPDNFRTVRVAAGNRETRTRGWLGYRLGSYFGYLSRARLKSLLFFSAAPAVSVHFIDVHPRDPMDVLAATADGLRRSRDGGYSWPTTLSGGTKAERHINHIGRDPNDPDHVIVGAQYGLYESFDGGDSFTPFVHGLVQGDARFVAFHPSDPKTFYVGMSWSLMRTTNGGKDFEILHLDPYPPYSTVGKVLVDPDQPTRIFIGTHDGLALSEDDGKTFARAGGATFVGSRIVGITAGPDPGHVFVATEHDLWQTQDAGRTWQVVLFGQVQWRITSIEPGAGGRVWMATEAELLELSREGSQRTPPGVLARHRARRAEEPPLQELVHRALKRGGVLRSEVDAYRARVPFSLALPRVALDVRQRIAPADFDRVDRAIGDESFFDNTLGSGQVGVQIFALWDLDDIIWRNDMGATELYRLAYEQRNAEWAIRETVVALYKERERLLFIRLAEPDPPLRTRLMRDLRLEELTAHLNALVGDVYDPFRAL